MLKLIPYELLKVWRKRSFLILTGVLLLINIFMLWYATMPKEGEAPLSAYKALSSDLSVMEEEEKYSYIARMKENLDGVSTLSEILSLQARGDEMGASLANQLLAENPDMIEKYTQLYLNGGYLKYTDDLRTEKALIDEIYQEMTTVSGYDAYLAGIQNEAASLREISIFGSAAGNGFSRHNIEKSAGDHAGASSENICFSPSKGIRTALERPDTDLLMILSVFLFIGSLITEEKEKGLFYITRATKNGVVNCIGAKLTALFLHVMAVCLLLYGANFIFTEITVGLCNFTAQLQSVAVYLESSLSVTLFQHVLLSLFTKGMVLFCLGTALTAVSICTSKSFLPQLVGVGWLGVNWAIYTAVPAYSGLNAVKYLSFFGMMKTEQLYGGYMNLNIAGNAVSRLSLSLLTVFVCCVGGVLASLLLFCKGKNLELRKNYQISVFPFRPHGDLLRHEAYKILVTNKALIILTAFAVLIGYRDLNKSFSPSVTEQYYAGVMASLQGGLTAEKEQLILTERARFEEAKSQIERIEQQHADGILNESTAEQMKLQWYGVLTFYPAFQRVEAQYAHVQATNGEFIYDTGYQYLFGFLDDSFIMDLLFLSLCVIFAFGNVMAMEEQKKSWYLLAATARGKRQIIEKKIAVCGAAAGVMVLLPWIFRFISISRAYPMGGLLSAVQNLPMYFTWGLKLPVLVFLILAAASQFIAVALAGAAVLLLSYKRKSYMQASFLSLLLLVVPLVLSVMGMDFAKWFSVYPIYSWMSF